MLGVMTLDTAWIALKSDSGLLGPAPRIRLLNMASSWRLPATCHPAWKKSNRYYLTRPPECHCQQLLRTGQLKRGVNIVECSRLKDAQEGRQEWRSVVPCQCADPA